MPDLRSFLDLYLNRGDSMLPVIKVFAVLDNAVFSNGPKKRSDAVTAITGSLIITSYLLNSFEQAKNHFAMAQAWSVLRACIARYAAKYAVPVEAWRESVALVSNAIYENLVRLRGELWRSRTSWKDVSTEMAG